MVVFSNAVPFLHQDPRWSWNIEAKDRSPVVIRVMQRFVFPFLMGFKRKAFCQMAYNISEDFFLLSDKNKLFLLLNKKLNKYFL